VNAQSAVSVCASVTTGVHKYRMLSSVVAEATCMRMPFLSLLCLRTFGGRIRCDCRSSARDTLSELI
jgi:hypothetical protein